VTDTRLHRLLDLVVRQLDASDARLEIGGKDPEDDRVVWCTLPSGWRLVATFEQPLSDRAEVLQRLLAVADAFATTATSATDTRPGGIGALAGRRLDDALHGLALRVSALRAVVIDDKSPVVWGTSEAHSRNEDVELALQIARVESEAAAVGLSLGDLLAAAPKRWQKLLAQASPPRSVAASLRRAVTQIRERSQRSGAVPWREQLLTARSISRVRGLAGEPSRASKLLLREEGFGMLARRFAGSYWLILVFDRAPSEVAADGAMLHALPAIENLVLALPPIEPPPSPGRVLAMRRRST